jgi:hypothetical protein
MAMDFNDLLNLMSEKKHRICSLPQMLSHQ